MASASARKCLPRLVDKTRTQCSMICCQYPREAKLLFPFPDSASYILLSEIGEAGVHRSDGVSILIEEKSPWKSQWKKPCSCSKTSCWQYFSNTSCSKYGHVDNASLLEIKVSTREFKDHNHSASIECRQCYCTQYSEETRSLFIRPFSERFAMVNHHRCTSCSCG